jgi:hypothetical protein
MVANNRRVSFWLFFDCEQRCRFEYAIFCSAVVHISRTTKLQNTNIGGFLRRFSLRYQIAWTIVILWLCEIKHVIFIQPGADNELAKGMGRN